MLQCNHRDAFIFTVSGNLRVADTATDFDLKSLLTPGKQTIHAECNASSRRYQWVSDFHYDPGNHAFFSKGVFHTLHINLNDPVIEWTLLRGFPGLKKITGYLTTEVSLQASGPFTALKTTGEGSMDIRQGAIINLNPVPEILKALMPSLDFKAGDKLWNGLDHFELIKSNFKIADSALKTGDFLIKHSEYLISGEGQYQYASGNQNLSLNLKLIIKN